MYIEQITIAEDVRGPLATHEDDEQNMTDSIAQAGHELHFDRHRAVGVVVNETGDPVRSFIFDNHPYKFESDRREREHGELMHRLDLGYCGESFYGEGYTVALLFDRYLPAEVIASAWRDVIEQSNDRGASAAGDKADADPRPRGWALSE